MSYKKGSSSKMKYKQNTAEMSTANLSLWDKLGFVRFASSTLSRQRTLSLDWTRSDCGSLISTGYLSPRAHAFPKVHSSGVTILGTR